MNFRAQALQVRDQGALCYEKMVKSTMMPIGNQMSSPSDEEADAYYNSRHPQSRLGAWSSDQSRPLESRQVLIDRTTDAEAKYGTENIPRPPHWSGFRVMAESIEFWQDGDYRLHDRIVFTKEGDGWSAPQRLYP